MSLSPRGSLTPREQQILQLLAQDPLISQQAVAERIGVSRSAAAGHIKRLTDKGIIRGRGYIFNEEPYVCVVGGANVDIEGRSIDALQPHDSNIGSVQVSPGGVGRNIAENLARLGVSTQLVTALGLDDNGEWLYRQTLAAGVDMPDVLWCDGDRTASYLSILDPHGEMAVAINDMAVLTRLDRAAIKARRPAVANAAVVVVDCNLEPETLDQLFSDNTHSTFFVDPVSDAKAPLVGAHLASVHTLKPNRTEAALLSGVQIRSERDVPRAASALLDKGITRVVVSLGSRGVFFARGGESGFVRPTTTVSSVTGAGDALMAGLVYAHMEQYEADDAVRFASAAAAVAAQSARTVAESMSVQTINSLLQRQPA